MAHSERLSRDTRLSVALIRLFGTASSLLRGFYDAARSVMKSSSTGSAVNAAIDRGGSTSVQNCDAGEHRLHRIAELARWGLIP